MTKGEEKTPWKEGSNQLYSFYHHSVGSSFCVISLNLLSDVDTMAERQIEVKKKGTRQ